MISAVDISPIAGRPVPRPLLIGLSVILALAVLGSVVWWRLNTNIVPADGASYRVLSTVNYGSLTIDGHATDWLTAPIVLHENSNVTGEIKIREHRAFRLFRGF